MGHVPSRRTPPRDLELADEVRPQGLSELLGGWFGPSTSFSDRWCSSWRMNASAGCSAGAGRAGRRRVNLDADLVSVAVLASALVAIGQAVQALGGVGHPVVPTPAISAGGRHQVGEGHQPRPVWPGIDAP
jgi:hypothetical protein